MGTAQAFLITPARRTFWGLWRNDAAECERPLEVGLEVAEAVIAAFDYELLAATILLDGVAVVEDFISGAGDEQVA